MSNFRLSRLFNPESGRALDVAIDHGMAGERASINGIENIAAAVSAIQGARPDAIQLTPGQARHLQAIPDRSKPALVLRTDFGNVYNKSLDSYLFTVHFPDAVEQALKLDAVCIVANLIDLPNHPEIREAGMRTIMKLKGKAERYGMPLMVEPLVMQDNPAGSYLVDGDTDKIVALVRQAVELGADLIKADPTNNLEEYHQVVEAASGLPLLVRGGGRVPDEEILVRTAKVLEQGARGIVYGRNIIQHHDPVGVTRALMAILHYGSTVEDALTLIASDK